MQDRAKKTARADMRLRPQDKVLYEARAAELGVTLTTFLEVAADRLLNDKSVKRLRC